MCKKTTQQPGTDHNGGGTGQVDIAAMSPRDRSLYELHMRIVQEAREGSVTATARHYHVSRTWVYRLLQRWEGQGAVGLVPRSRAHHNDPHRVGRDMRDRVVAAHHALKDGGWGAGAASIHDRMLHDGLEPPSVGTIHSILKAAGLTIHEPHKRPRRSLQRFEAALPNETWQGDFTHWRCQDGTDARIQTWLDDHSRMVLYCKAFTTLGANDVLDSFLTACGEYGVPASTLTDNGREYTPGHERGDRMAHPFTRALVLLGVEQKNGKPGHPQTQGKIERWHRTLKQWLRRRPRPHDLAELQSLLDEFVYAYNHERPHRALDGHTPWDAYHERTKAWPAALEDTCGMLDTHAVARLGVTADTDLWAGEAVAASDANGLVRGIKAGTRTYDFALGKRNARLAVLVGIEQGIVTIVAQETGEILRQGPVDTAKRYQAVPARHPSRNT